MYDLSLGYLYLEISCDLQSYNFNKQNAITYRFIQENTSTIGIPIFC